MTINLTVYSGRTFLGSVREAANGSCEAFDADGRSLGTFPKRKAAVAAIPAVPDGSTPAGPAGARR